LQKIPLEKLGGARLRRRLKKDPACVLARPQYFAAARPTPARIGRSEVEKLERPIQRKVASLRATGRSGPQCASNFTADIGQLFHKTERLPSAGNEGLW
jgi:hypothetical protein